MIGASLNAVIIVITPVVVRLTVSHCMHLDLPGTLP